MSQRKQTVQTVEIVCCGVENPEICLQYYMLRLSLLLYLQSMLIYYRVIEHQSFGLSPITCMGKVQQIPFPLKQKQSRSSSH